MPLAADGVDELCGSTSSAERSAVGARQRVGYVASMGATDALTATDVLKRRAAALQRILGLMIMQGQGLWPRGGSSQGAGLSSTTKAYVLLTHGPVQLSYDPTPTPSLASELLGSPHTERRAELNDALLGRCRGAPHASWERLGEESTGRTRS